MLSHPRDSQQLPLMLFTRRDQQPLCHVQTLSKVQTQEAEIPAPPGRNFGLDARDISACTTGHASANLMPTYYSRRQTRHYTHSGTGAGHCFFPRGRVSLRGNWSADTVKPAACMAPFLGGYTENFQVKGSGHPCASLNPAPVYDPDVVIGEDINAF